MTVEKAKAESLRMQEELIGFFPADWVSARQTDQTAPLRRCGGADDAYQWTGFSKLTFGGPKPTDTVIDQIAEHYAGSTLEVRAYDDRTGARTVQLTGADGSSYLVGPEAKDDSNVTIDAWSPCFVLPEGDSPLLDY